MLETTFAATELSRILEQAAIYDCACPAQICKQIGSLRSLYDYQMHCQNMTDSDRQVHERIAAAVHVSHAEMERCLEDVLALEGWDRATLTMPENLQKRLFDAACQAGEPDSSPD